MLDREAVSYLRDRRATLFFRDAGPSLPPGMRARWRLTPNDPHGWHANMVGCIDGAAAGLPVLIDTATRWFDRYHVDTWVDADEFGVMFRQGPLLEERRFQLVDDWDAMLCRSSEHTPLPPTVTISFAHTEEEIALSARIAEEVNRNVSVPPGDPALQRRTARFWQEYSEWGSRFALAHLAGRPVGSARLTDEDLPLVLGVGTLPEMRGRGVATALVSALTREALRRRGACALYVDRGSQAARIYARLGYRPLFRTRAWLRPYVPPASG